MISQIFGHGALKKRIAENRKKLYQAAYSWSHDPQLSDDLAHEAMIKALENLAGQAVT